MLYYWFIAGFGDVERLAHSHFPPKDIPIVTVVSSLIVQGYFCYRIWIMSRSRSRQSSWICLVIAVASIQEYPRIIRNPDVFPSAEYDYSICCREVGASQSAPRAPLPKRFISLPLVARGREVRSFQDSCVCMPTLPVELAMPSLTFQVIYGPYLLPWQTFSLWW